VRPFLPLAERLGTLFTALAGGIVDTLEVSYEGQIADYDCSVLTLAVLKGVLGAVVDEPVTFVNAPQLARDRGLTVRETTSTSARSFVNLITLRGQIGDRDVHVAGTLAGRDDEPRIVGIDDHVIDIPPARHMLIVRNEDRPMMIGRVGMIVGEAGINIADMRVGKSPSGEAAMMALTTSSTVPADLLDALRAEPGILDAKSIELG
jgi:D-3-phosphoglycerate dehydrogenase